jgi:hypothetical protein
MTAISIAPTTFSYPSNTDEYWAAFKECRMTIQKEIDWSRLKSKTEAEVFGLDDDFSREDHFHITAQIKTSFFLCTLLTRSTETGVQFALESNFRKATVDALTSQEEFPTSLYEHCYMDDENSTVFSEDSLQFFMYEMQPTDEEQDQPSGDLFALAREDVKTDQSYRGANLKINGVSGRILGRKEFNELCYILNVQVRQLGECYNKQLFDYKTLFQKFRDEYDGSNKELEETLVDTLGWPFFKVKDDLPFRQNLRRVRSFFQTLTGVGLSVVEGNHRMTLAGKLIYGQHIKDTIPCKKKSPEYKDLPEHSPLNQEIKVEILTFQDMTADTSKIVSQEQLKMLRDKSHKVAKDKERRISATWKDWLSRGVAMVANKEAYIKEKDFFELKTLLSQKKMDPKQDAYQLNNLIRRKVVGELFCEEDPGASLSEKAFYKTEKNPAEKKFDKKQFFEKFVNLPKPCDYINRGGFAFVSDMQAAENNIFQSQSDSEF